MGEPNTDLAFSPSESAASGLQPEYCIVQDAQNPRKKRKRFGLFGNKMTIGRAPEVDIQILSQNVSRVHAILARSSTGWNILDNKSTNGVFINGNRIKACQNYVLCHQDVFSLGPLLRPTDEIFKFSFLRNDGSITKFESPPTDLPPCKMAKSETEGHTEELPKTMDEADALRNKLVELEQQLKVKENSEKALQEELKNQQKEHELKIESERERTRKDKEETEMRLKLEMQSKMQTQEQQLRQLMTNQQHALLNEKQQIEAAMKQKIENRSKEMDEKLQREQQKLAQDLAISKIKAEHLEIQLKNSITLHDQAKAEMLNQVGNLMETEMTCTICSELFIIAMTLNCSHTFCKVCIAEWKKKKKECPICRGKIKNETRALVIDNFIEKMVDNLPVDMQKARKETIALRNVNALAAAQAIAGRGGTAAVRGAFQHSSQVPRQQLYAFLNQSAPQANPRPHHAPTPQTVQNPSVIINRLPGQSITIHHNQGFAARPLYQEIRPATNELPQGRGRANFHPQQIRFVYRQPEFNVQTHVIQGQNNSRTSMSIDMQNQSNLALGLARSLSSYVTQPLNAGSNQRAAPQAQAGTSRNQAIVLPDGSRRVEGSRSLLTSVRGASSAAQGAIARPIAQQASSDQAYRNAIVISDSDEETGTDSQQNSSSSSASGNSDVYYGGYGRCFSCGRRGHWSNGCPNR